MYQYNRNIKFGQYFKIKRTLINFEFQQNFEYNYTLKSTLINAQSKNRILHSGFLLYLNA